MSLDRTATTSLVRPMLRRGLLRSKAGIPILMYHSISEEAGTARSAYYGLTTSPRRFREHLQWLRAAGYAVISLDEAVGRLVAGTVDNQRMAVLTFDDGFRDFMTGAWPLLQEFGFTASVFLPTAHISNTRKTFKGRECLTWAEVAELDRLGISFGGHTVNHPELYRLSWKEIARELRESRLRIEHELQKPVRTFAYPFAFPQEDPDFVRRFRDEILAQGYATSVTTMIGRARPTGRGAVILPRLPVNEFDTEALFGGKLDGAYDWVGRIQLLSRRVRKRSFAFRSSWPARSLFPVT